MTEDTRPAVEAFDLADYEDVSAADVTLKDPVTGAHTAMSITLAGPEHPQRRKLLYDRQRKMRAQLQKTGKVQLGDPAEDEEADTDMLVACTLGWQGLTLAGQALAYSTAAAEKLYTDPKRRWLRDQVKSALDEREAFIKRSVVA